jgi:type IV pilus assembly protein PilC
MPNVGAPAQGNILTRVHLTAKEREYFTDNLALLLKAGVAVGEALQSMQDTAASKRLADALGQLKHDVDEGVPLYRALEKHSLASRQTLALVELGEQSGKLVDNLRVAAKQEQKQRIFHSKVRSALLYPTFVLSMTLVVGLGVAWFLLPKLSETFGQLDVNLPLISKVFIGFGTFLKQNGAWAIPVFLVALAAAGYMLFGYPKTRKYGQRFLMHVPGVSKLMREVEIARFGYLLGTLLDAGLSVTQSLQLLGKATGADDYQKLYAYLHRSFEEGYSFSSSLPKYKGVNKLLPPAVQQMVIAGERSGALPETLANVGTIYEEKADVSTANLEAVLEPILLVIVWIGVMGVAVSVILPIYSLVGGLEQ